MLNHLYVMVNYFQCRRMHKYKIIYRLELKVINYLSIGLFTRIKFADVTYLYCIAKPFSGYSYQYLKNLAIFKNNLAFAFYEYGVCYMHLLHAVAVV